jgi:N-acetyl-gamma-glutamyl-phosphate reductase
VRGTNHCLIGVHPSRIPEEAILVSVTDNLVKGASGQAIQNMNIMLGIDERFGLGQRPLFP